MSAVHSFWALACLEWRVSEHCAQSLSTRTLKADHSSACALWACYLLAQRMCTVIRNYAKSLSLVQHIEFWSVISWISKPISSVISLIFECHVSNLKPQCWETMLRVSVLYNILNSECHLSNLKTKSALICSVCLERFEIGLGRFDNTLNIRVSCLQSQTPSLQSQNTLSALSESALGYWRHDTRKSSECFQIWSGYD